MKLWISFCFALTTTIGFAQEKSDDAKSIRAALESLTGKAILAEDELNRLATLYGERHPSMVAAKAQLERISHAKTQLAAQYAMSKLRDGNIQLQKHLDILTEQSAKLQMLMSEEISQPLQTEYQKLKATLMSSISMLQSQIKKGKVKADKDLHDLLRATKIDPQFAAEQYKKALDLSLESALKDGKNAIETEKRHIESMKQRMIDQMAKLTDQQNALKNKKKSAEKNRDAEFHSYEAQKALMQNALEDAKKAKALADKQKTQALENATKELDALKKDFGKKSSNVDTRLAGVESELAEVKALLKKLIEKTK